MTTSDGIAIHHRDDGFGQATDLHLYVEYTETGYSVFINIAATPLHVHVATRAEGMLHIRQGLTLRYFRHRSREQHHRDVLHLTAHCKSLRQFPSGLGGEGVTITGTVDGDLGDAII